MSDQSPRVPVRILDAVGQARNWAYAMWVCNGYNPTDSVFWGMMESKPPSDQAWRICAPWIVEQLGDIILVPAHFAT